MPIGMKGFLNKTANVTPKKITKGTNIQETDTRNALLGIKCRINDSSYNEFIKVFFLPEDVFVNEELLVREGFLVYSIEDNKTYEVTNAKCVYNKKDIVHVTCRCKKAPNAARSAVR